ncbi:MAG: C1 family peptidase, partial [Gemmatimonadota bacterium]
FLGKQRIEQMVAALTDRTPLMVEIRVGSNFQIGYDGTAVYRPTGTLDLLHAVCILGYGTDPLTEEPFWIAKNSYGDDWGDKGQALLLWGDPDVRPEFKVFVMRSVSP